MKLNKSNHMSLILLKILRNQENGDWEGANILPLPLDSGIYILQPDLSQEGNSFSYKGPLRKFSGNQIQVARGLISWHLRKGGGKRKIKHVESLWVIAGFKIPLRTHY